MAEQPALPAWHAEHYRRMAERRPGLVTIIEATTPDHRDRAVDALRALAIVGVVLGHWLVTGLVDTGGVLRAASPLTSMPALTPISWVLQTLAIFFLVGGYTAARGHRPRGHRARGHRARGHRALHDAPHGGDQEDGGRRSDGYRAWLGRRAARLLVPVPILLALWAAAVPLLIVAGYPVGTIWSLVQLVLDPLWFLLVYLGLTALTPVVAGAVRRYGAWAAAIPVAITALVDLARFVLGAPGWIAWITVASAWLVPFTLGAAWAQGSFTARPHRPRLVPTAPARAERPIARMAPAAGPWALLLGGGTATAALIWFAGYPASMVGVPGQAVSNLSPPTLAAVTFGMAQCGAALLLRGPLTSLMRRPMLWAGVAMVNLSAMTIFLWHQSAMLGVSALVTRITDTVPGLLDPPDHAGWILHRLVWIPVFAAVLAGLWSLAHRFERRIRSQPAGSSVHLTKRPDDPDETVGTRRTTTGCAEY
ncbi:acyltransferase family protein [Actinomadura gamaensis]|uniref:Acyltransferase n=1 Tax=Actinomadura gamaensis TaxID=1763541 RepID=A0ABV9U967_9ACTN